MENQYIVAAARTAVGSFGGSLASIPAYDLGAVVLAEVCRRANLAPDQVDEVIMGGVLQAGLGQGAARRASLAAGFPESVPAWGLNNICGSGLKSIAVAQAMVAAGQAQCIACGGMESMSRAPHAANFVREPKKMGNVEMVDTMIVDGLTDAKSGKHMGFTAEAIAEKYGLTRVELDTFAAASQEKALRAVNEGVFDEEIVAVSVPQRKGEPLKFARDEYPRSGSTVEVLGKLRPAFKPDGVVTAGNASGLNDGAAAVLVASESFVNVHHLKPLAKIVATATTALDPWYMGLGPIEATRKALKIAGWSIADLELAELNEAFASQSLACIRDLGIEPQIVNINGGAIALGHPLGASGARILTTLLYGLKRTGKKRGLATLCVGGGMGVAMLVEAQ